MAGPRHRRTGFTAQSGAAAKRASRRPDIDAFTINYPDLDPARDFDFDDHGEVAARLPRIAALYPE
ncbi:hypothetical protein [Streptomyces sp. NPDC001999]